MCLLRICERLKPDPPSPLVKGEPEFELKIENQLQLIVPLFKGDLGGSGLGILLDQTNRIRTEPVDLRHFYRLNLPDVSTVFTNRSIARKHSSTSAV